MSNNSHHININLTNLMNEVDEAFRDDDHRLAKDLIEKVGSYYNHKWGDAPTEVLDRLAGWKSNLNQSTEWIWFLIRKREGKPLYQPLSSY